jgi:hypothetical protein
MVRVRRPPPSFGLEPGGAADATGGTAAASPVAAAATSARPSNGFWGPAPSLAKDADDAAALDLAFELETAAAIAQSRQEQTSSAAALQASASQKGKKQKKGFQSGKKQSLFGELSREAC